MQLFHAIATSILPWLIPLWVLHGASNGVRPRVLEEGGTTQNRIQLRLTTEIINERYCKESGSDTSDNLVMKLRLRYTNNGSSHLILYKHDNTILRETVSRDSKDARYGRYLWDMSLTTVTGGNDLTLDRDKPSSSFAYLAPGGSYEAIAELVVFVARNGRARELDGLLPGNYSLQVIVSTWPESEGVAEALRKRWEANGALWYKNVKSEPMTFRVEKNPNLVVCQEP